MLQFSQFSHSCTMNLYGELGHLIQLCRVWCTHEDRDKETLKTKACFAALRSNAKVPSVGELVHSSRSRYLVFISVNIILNKMDTLSVVSTG